MIVATRELGAAIPSFASSAPETGGSIASRSSADAGSACIEVPPLGFACGVGGIG
jgi:hypothetical protein